MVFRALNLLGGAPWFWNQKTTALTEGAGKEGASTSGELADVGGWEMEKTARSIGVSSRCE